MTTPLYAELVSFGSYIFTAQSGYTTEFPRQRNRKVANLLGQAYPVDALAGGVAPYQSTDITFLYWIVASDAAITAGTASQSVETQWSNLVAVSESTNMDGTSGELQTLTVKLQSGGTVSVAAALIDCTPRDTTRTFSTLQLNIVFRIWGQFA